MPIEIGGKEVKETWIWKSLDLGLDPRPPFPAIFIYEALIIVSLLRSLLRVTLHC